MLYMTLPSTQASTAREIIFQYICISCSGDNAIIKHHFLPILQSCEQLQCAMYIWKWKPWRLYHSGSYLHMNNPLSAQFSVRFKQRQLMWYTYYVCRYHIEWCVRHTVFSWLVVHTANDSQHFSTGTAESCVNFDFDCMRSCHFNTVITWVITVWTVQFGLEIVKLVTTVVLNHITRGQRWRPGYVTNIPKVYYVNILLLWKLCCLLGTCYYGNHVIRNSFHGNNIKF